MNQELMTLDFWQDTVIYESKTFPVGTLACDALNVPVNTIAKINEQCEKINLLLGILNAGQDASALCPIANRYIKRGTLDEDLAEVMKKLAKDKMLQALSNVAYAKGDYEKEMGQAALKKEALKRI